MSAEIAWECIRNNSAFLRKKGVNKAKQIFSAEPGHLTGLNRFSVSTLVGASALTVQKTGKKETIVLKTRTKGEKGLRKPAKAVVKTGINKCAKKAAKAITASVDKAYNRRDLQSKIAAKYAAIAKSMKTKKVVRKANRPKKA